MPWLKIDDVFTEHPKVLSLSDAAFRVHVHALCYCVRLKTDGVVTQAALRSLRGTPSLAKQLVDASCWELHDEGWLVHDFLEYNPSREQLEAERERKQEAGRRGGLARGSGVSKGEAGA